jgi:hypothetical protein
VRSRYGEQSEYHRQRANRFGQSADEATNRNSRKMYRHLTMTERVLAERAERLGDLLDEAPLKN